MRKNLLLAFIAFSTVANLYAQDKKVADETFPILTGGTFAKPKIVPSLNKLAIAQSSIYFKNVTTREVMENERGGLLGGRKSLGGSVTGRLTAYLDITDGEMSQQDYQQLADGFYQYLNQKLASGGISTVDWNAIAATQFYKEEGMNVEDLRKDENEMKKKGQIYTLVNSNAGSSLWRYNVNGGISPGFSFGKIKKASQFSEDLGAPVVFMHLTVDFADIVLDGDVKTGTSRQETMFYTKVTTSKKWKMDAEVGANVKVVAHAGSNYFWNQKSQAELMTIARDIPSNTPFASAVVQDESKEKLRAKDNIFAKDFNLTPMVVSTTKQKYMEAAKKALENYADMFVAKIQGSKKA